MKVYFAGSIRGGRSDADLYKKLINHIQKSATVLTEHVGSASLTEMGEGDAKEDFIHDRDMEWLLQSDAVIAEVTQPSLGVGYEIGRAIEHNIPVHCLFRTSSEKSLSAMIRGSNDVTVYEYTNLEEGKNAIDEILKNVTST